MVEAVWGRLRHSRRGERREPSATSPIFVVIAGLRWAVAIALLALIGWGLASEARTSYLQSRIFSHFARETSFSVERQAKWSPPLTRFVDQGGYALYREKPRAGLTLFDREQNLLYQTSHPERAYPDFASIPPLVVKSLLFIEDRDLLDPENPGRNPAVQWGRFMLAVAGRVAGVFDHRFREGGASTLATQIEKFRHSPGGRTLGVIEKLRQMVSASALAYRDGTDTNPARQQIVTTYLNSEPLASRPGYGEIIGVPDALWFWYGTDLAVANRVLTAPATTKAEIAH